jgi:hypothetical protein
VALDTTSGQKDFECDLDPVGGASRLVIASEEPSVMKVHAVRRRPTPPDAAADAAKASGIRDQILSSAEPLYVAA